MLPSSTDLGPNDERQLDSRSERSTLARWIDDVLYYGFAQVTGLGLLALWTVLQTPYVDLVVKTAAVVAYPATMLAIGTFRSGVLSAGRPWPRLETRRLGTGEGYQAYLTRAVYVSTALLLGTYGAALVALVADATLIAIPAAAVLAVGSIALFPHLTVPGRRRWVARGAYYLVGLGVAFALSTPLDVSVGDPLTVAYFAVLGVLAAYDLSSRGWRNVADVR
jgi:hypothetical protein